MNEIDAHIQAMTITIFNTTLSNGKNSFLLMNTSRNIVKASFKFHHTGDEKAIHWQNYCVKRDEATYAYRSLMTDVNTG